MSPPQVAQHKFALTGGHQCVILQVSKGEVVAQQELALTGRAPASPSHSSFECSRSVFDEKMVVLQELALTGRAPFHMYNLQEAEMWVA